MSAKERAESTSVPRSTAEENAIRRPKTIEEPRSPLLAAIRTQGRLLDDLERLRIQHSNRIGALERDFGSSLPALDLAVGSLREIEHEAELELCRMWRKHPLAPWAKNYRGLGEKSIARLIALVDDPADRPNPAKFMAYCGFGDPARISFHKNMTQDEFLARGNKWAKKQTWLIATSMLKAGNRAIYDEARGKYKDATHEANCARCGPAGHPALPGSPLSDGHKHARAIRATAKAFLLDLWLAAREL